MHTNLFYRRERGTLHKRKEKVFDLKILLPSTSTTIKKSERERDGDEEDGKNGIELITSAIIKNLLDLFTRVGFFSVMNLN